MKRKPLQDAELRAAQPREKTYRLSDTIRGLRFEVRPSGVRLWIFRYKIDSKQYNLGLGSYPDTTLALARKKATELREALADGRNPALERHAARAEKKVAQARVENTFEAVAMRWLAVMEKTWKPRHAYTVRHRLARFLLPHLGHLPVDEVTAPVLLRVLQDGPIADDSLDTASKVKVICGQVMRFAIAHGLAVHDPASALRGALPRKRQVNHAHILDPVELAEMLRAIDSYRGDFTTCIALKLTPMLMLRPGEIRSIMWREVNLEAGELRLDHDAAELDLERDSRKLHKDLVVPLPRQAVELLKMLVPLTGHGRYVFPSQRTLPGSKHERPMSENTIGGALKRLGYKGRQTPHGFRHTASTLLNELGFHGDAVERQLSHEPRDQIRGVYDKSTRLEERRAMLQAWADHLDRLRAGATVLPFQNAG